jgi:aminoglycoside phosphotransferase (APT) family kinase protein
MSLGSKEISRLSIFLKENGFENADEISLEQFKGGFSNLTYLLKLNDQDFVLRRPPMGAKISKAHDMLREFKVIQSLEKAAYSKTPKPILACEDPHIIGAPFFLMEKVEGEIFTDKLSIEPGASFTGACNMGAKVKDLKKEEPVLAMAAK